MTRPSKNSFSKVLVPTCQIDGTTYRVIQKLDKAIQKHSDVVILLNGTKKIRSEQMKTRTDPEDERFFLLKNFDYSCYAIKKIKTLNSSEEESPAAEQIALARVHSHLWSACKDIITFCKKFPSHTNWFFNTFVDLDNKASCALIMLETLSEVWGPTEFALAKRKFEDFYKKQQDALRQEMETSHPEGYIRSEDLGLPVGTDLVAACLGKKSQEKLSHALDLLILFQGDVKTFLSTQFKETPPTIEDITTLGEDLLDDGLLKSAQTCLESIPTPELCEDYEEWHETYDTVLRYTGQHEKATALRWKYFQAVKTADAACFYLHHTIEHINPSFTKNEAEAYYEGHRTKVKQAIILDFPLEEAVDISLELWCESLSYDDLLDDLMLHYYNHNKLSSCPTYLLQNLLDKIKNDLYGSEGENAPMLAALMAYRTLIQRKWRNKDKMSAQKSQEFRNFIDQAQKVDTKLTRTTTTQHIPSHQEFMNHLKTKHSQTVTPLHSLSSPRPTL